MRLLILATPRSGSSAFHAAVTEANKLKWVTEPFNYELHENWDGNKQQLSSYDFLTNPMDVPDGFSIKALTFFNHWPDRFADHWEDGIDAYMKVYDTSNYQTHKLRFFLNYMDRFDRTILLLRRDFGDQLRSMLIGMQKEKIAGRRLNSHWNQKYDGFDPVLNDEGALNARLLFDSIRMIEKISALRKIPIVFYEDIFNSKSIFDATNAKHGLGLGAMWEKHFDPQKRWRRNQE